MERKYIGIKGFQEEGGEAGVKKAGEDEERDRWEKAREWELSIEIEKRKKKSS